MITLTGKKVSEGIAIGKLSFYKRDTKENRRIYVKDVEKEVMRFQKARQKAILELKILYDTAAKEVGEANAAIFEMQQAILEDRDFIDQITNIIATQKLNAEYAIQSVAQGFISDAVAKEKDYVQGHDADVKDVANRVLRILSRGWKDKMLTDEPFVLANCTRARQCSWIRPRCWGLPRGMERSIPIRRYWRARKESPLSLDLERRLRKIMKAR
jgi:phosphotransferase system enzyme I (PtsI)